MAAANPTVLIPGNMHAPPVVLEFGENNPSPKSRKSKSMGRRQSPRSSSPAGERNQLGKERSSSITRLGERLARLGNSGKFLSKDRSNHRRLPSAALQQVKDQLINEGEMWECMDCAYNENVLNRDIFCLQCHTKHPHPWECTICTLLNKEDHLQCDACGSMRPTLDEGEDFVYAPTKKKEHGVVLLWSSFAGTKNHGVDRSNTDRIVHMLNSYGWEQETYERVNGCMPEDRLRRDQLTAISGKRGLYPQLFMDGRYVGSYKEVEEMNETGQLKVELDDIRARIVLRV